MGAEFKSGDYIRFIIYLPAHECVKDSIIEDVIRIGHKMYSLCMLEAYICNSRF